MIFYLLLCITIIIAAWCTRYENNFKSLLIIILSILIYAAIFIIGSIVVPQSQVIATSVESHKLLPMQNTETLTELDRYTKYQKTVVQVWEETDNGYSFQEYPIDKLYLRPGRSDPYIEVSITERGYSPFWHKYLFPWLPTENRIELNYVIIHVKEALP